MKKINQSSVIKTLFAIIAVLTALWFGSDAQSATINAIDTFVTVAGR